MIVFNGSKIIDGVYFLSFKNSETNNVVEIPVEKKTYIQFSAYFDKLSPPKPEPIEYGNDEASI